jgi:hypothetical protein
MFVLRVPVLNDLAQAHGYGFDGSVDETGLGVDVGMYVADGTNAFGSEANGACAAFVSFGLGSALQAYQAVVNAIDVFRGAGIRWMLYADPNLPNL